MNKVRVLVVEDDPAVRLGLVDTLSCGGYEVLECARGDEAVSAAARCEPDLVLLDVLLPGQDGFEVLEQLRVARPVMPVIMVTARGTEHDRVRGLRGGADDYVVKPFSALELLARVEAVLRRSAERPHPVRNLRSGERLVDFERREVRVGTGAPKPLSEREYQLLHYLALCRGRAISREEILRHVWGLDPRGMTTRAIDMHVLRLREKLDDPNGEAVIITVRATGYRLADSVEVERT